MKLGDRTIGFLTALAGVALLNTSWQMDAPPGQSIGAGYFPLIIAVTLIVSGLALAAFAQWRVRNGARAPAWLALPEFARSHGALLSIALLLGAIVFYIYAVVPLGLIPTAAIVTLALTLRLGMRWRWALVTAPVLAIAFHLLLVAGLRVALPPGILAGWI